MAVQRKEMNLVLSSDAKPRLKWTQELHQRFVDAINQLGGAEKATPKSLMRVMGIPGLTLYHLKSHLQKYRLGRSQQSQIHQHNKKENYGENQKAHFSNKSCDGAEEKINESVQISQALQIQMDVQKHLQLRIEAQGKYLQSVLRKAQETLSGYSSCSIEVEHARAQLSQLVSMVDSGCPSSTFSVLTESENSMLKDPRKEALGHNGCSLESSLTSSESYEVDENYENSARINKGKRILSLMEMHSAEESESDDQASKRSKRTIDLNY
ncbi:hypothetical protein BUALT_Bualt17G0071200 [Buddleja alternifolia]|uniref:Uncharacterized protein n=1 Tax=Buddleja alternifolia TaxID=168488 RepID=A0AAV6WHA6_9LAMI|nr:hypothetical protein BUALT_Bualt17G0071200 [Buddleja alternifolia]